MNYSLKYFNKILIDYNIVAGVVPFRERVGANIVLATPAR
jgi:hypothetical protein